MRAFDGQHSDRVAIKRSPEEKRRLLAQLREQYAALKPTVAESIRTSMAQRIAELEREVQVPRGAGPNRPTR